MDDLDALLQDALDDFDPAAAVAAPAADGEADIHQLAAALRALVGDIGAADFRPRMETLVQQAERLAKEATKAEQRSA